MATTCSCSVQNHFACLLLGHPLPQTLLRTIGNVCHTITSTLKPKTVTTVEKRGSPHKMKGENILSREKLVYSTHSLVNECHLLQNKTISVPVLGSAELLVNG